MCGPGLTVKACDQTKRIKFYPKAVNESFYPPWGSHKAGFCDWGDRSGSSSASLSSPSAMLGDESAYGLSGSSAAAGLGGGLALCGGCCVLVLGQHRVSVLVLGQHRQEQGPSLLRQEP